MSQARKRYLRSYLGGVALTVVTMFIVLLLHWGALRGVPIRPLNGIIVVCTVILRWVLYP